MPELIVFGAPAVGLIIVLVELAKHYGLNTRCAPLVAIGAGVVFSLLGKVASMHALFAEWYEVIVIGVVAGLIAAGLYSGQKAIRGQ